MNHPVRLADAGSVMGRDFPSIEVTASTVERCRKYGLGVRKPFKGREYEVERERVVARKLA